MAVGARSVNHRFLDLKLRLPPEAIFLEPKIKRLVSRHLDRGRVDLSVILRREAAVPDVRLNVGLLRGYVKAARAAQKETGVSGELSLATLLQLPGALRLEDGSGELPRPLSAGILQAVEDAVAGLREMREREGAALGRDLHARIRSIRRRLTAIRRRAGGLTERLSRKLTARVRKLSRGVDASPERLAQEIAFLADRCDISEEMVRLEAHLDAMQSLLRKRDPAGKRLDFLTQELLRETNTIHSKAGDLDISRAAIEIKSELEKIREQVQNIE